MSLNPNVTIDIAEKTYGLYFDWDAIASLESTFGFDRVANLVSTANMGELADVISIGLKKHHPEMTAADVYEASPPVYIMRKAIDRALSIAYFGTDTPEDVVGDVKKKKRGLSSFLLFALGFASGCGLVIFGL